MYAKHFGLRRDPFSIAPDPRFLFMSDRHREALAHLLYGLRGSGGVVLLTGEIGAGKTTVCRCFLEQVPKECNVAYIFNPKLTVIELLQTVCEEFRITLTTPSLVRTVKDYVDALNGHLLATHAKGENNVLIIDEAQNLSADVLEQLRLLTNLETSERKLLQIILIGQPELRTLLATPEMEQLAQRVTARYHLEALNDQETNAYIRHRLVVSGRTGGNPFDAGARQRIHRLARGVPRRINLLCDRSMLGAYARGTQRVTATMVDEAAHEVFGPDALHPAWRAKLHALTQRRDAWVAAGVLGGLVCLALLLWAWPKRDTAASVARVNAAVKSSAAAAGAASASGAPAAASGGSAAFAGGALQVAGVAAASTTGTDTLTTADPLVMPPALKPLRDEKQAWRLLALTALISLAEGDPCQAAAKVRLTCAKRTDGTLEQLRRLGEPAMLVLRDAQGKATYIIHTGIADERSIMARGDGGERVKLDLLSLASRWRGEFGTFKDANVTKAPTP